MSAAAKHAVDIAAAIMAAASMVLSVAQAVTPVVATMTTFMAFAWWCHRYWSAFRRRRRELRKGSGYVDL